MMDSEEELKKQCIEKGEKVERNEDIKHWYWVHDHGIVMYYENSSKDFVLKEQIQLQNNTTKFDGGHKNGGTKVDIEVLPGKEKIY